MARLRHTRRITADDGSKVEFELYFSDGHLVDDDRNGVVATSTDGNAVRVPISQQAFRNTADWIARKTES